MRAENIFIRDTNKDISLCNRWQLFQKPTTCHNVRNKQLWCAQPQLTHLLSNPPSKAKGKLWKRRWKDYKIQRPQYLLLNNDPGAMKCTHEILTIRLPKQGIMTTPVDMPPWTEKIQCDPTLNEELRESAISSKVVQSEVVIFEYMYKRATLSELNSYYINMCICTYAYTYVCKSVIIMWYF